MDHRHHAVGVALGQVDIDDDGIARVLGIDLADDLAADALVGADRAEGLVPECRGFRLLDHDLGDTGVGWGGGRDGSASHDRETVKTQAGAARRGTSWATSRIFCGIVVP